MPRGSNRRRSPCSAPPRGRLRRKGRHPRAPAGPRTSVAWPRGQNHRRIAAAPPSPSGTQHPDQTAAPVEHRLMARPPGHRRGQGWPGRPDRDPPDIPLPGGKAVTSRICCPVPACRRPSRSACPADAPAAARHGTRQRAPPLDPYQRDGAVPHPRCAAPVTSNGCAARRRVARSLGRASSPCQTSAARLGRGQHLQLTSVSTPSVPQEPAISFTRSYPVTFFITRPPF